VSGFILIFGVLCIINFVYGVVMMFVMYVSYWFFVFYGVDFYVLVFIIALFFFFIGVGIEKVLIEFNRVVVEYN